MCNKRYDIEDWQDKPCDNCKASKWFLVVYNHPTILCTEAVLECEKCKTSFCHECGEIIDVEQILKDGLLRHKQTKLETIIKAIERVNKFEATMPHTDRALNRLEALEDKVYDYFIREIVMDTISPASKHEKKLE